MSKINPRFALAFSLIAIAGLVLAGCSGGSSGGNQPVTVQVTLTDFKIDSSLTTFSVGVPYHFVITNKGSVAHELVIMPPASDPATMEASRKMALVTVTQQDLPSGGSKTVDYTFATAAPDGTLEFACHVTGHYEAGMHAPIVVK